MVAPFGIIAIASSAETVFILTPPSERMAL
jgi:hypothetical protein